MNTPDVTFKVDWKNELLELEKEARGHDYLSSHLPIALDHAVMFLNYVYGNKEVFECAKIYCEWRIMRERNPDYQFLRERETPGYPINEAFVSNRFATWFGLKLRVSQGHAFLIVLYHCAVDWYNVAQSIPDQATVEKKLRDLSYIDVK